jgi:hypothetical protein
LHEIAHTAKSFLDVESPHGREFCKRLLELVKHEMGIESYKTLRESFKNNRVKVRGSDQDWENRRIEKKNKKIAKSQEKIIQPVYNTIALKTMEDTNDKKG